MPILDATTGIAYATLSAAILGADAGDVIQLSAGTYTEDLPRITKDLTIESVGGMATLQGPPGGLANDEGILVIDADVTLKGLEITGATGSTGNDAGIRFETGNLTISNCWVHDNQEGLLANPDSAATISIIDSEFNNNGDVGGPYDGFTHNVYVNEIGTLSITGSYFHDALDGHEIKSRADNTIITNSRIQDGPTAQSNYAVDLPDGGAATISGNTIEKGPNDPNWTIIHWGGEANPVYAGSSLAITGNTVVNDMDPANAQPPFVNNMALDGDGNLILPTVTGNRFYGLPNAQLLQVTPLNGDPQYFLPADPALNTFLPHDAAPALNTAHPFTVPCFAAGTRIRTPHGETPVEHLRVGDHIVTRTGAARRIRWIGRRSYDAASIAANPPLQPIRIRAGALADGIPHTDLFLSPLHALFLRQALVPAAALVNGASIRSCPDHGAVAYLHVELDSHDIVLANGTPAESFLDCDSRPLFDNAATAAPISTSRCAPRLEHGPVLAALRSHFAARAGIAETRNPPATLQGHVEAAGPGWVEGWVLDPANPDHPVALELRLDAHPVARVLANRYRGDLHAAGLAGGRCAFIAMFPPRPGHLTVMARNTPLSTRLRP